MGARLLQKHSGRARLTGWVASALMLAVCGASFVKEARGEVIAPRHNVLQFPRPASIEPNVKFWVDVFSGYSVRDFVVHDKDQIWKVYQVLHIPGEGNPTPADVEWANTYLKAKYADI